MIRGLVALVALSVSCQSSGNGPDDSGPDDRAADAGVDAETAAVDAATSTCAGPGDCACFSNYDCPDTHACTSLDETGENVWCLEGARGAGAAGVLCDGEADCASALCVEDETGTFRCSDLCEGPEECPDSLPRCLFIGFGVDESICAPPGPA